MEVTGRCHCGAITWRAEADPARTRVCHCTDCQRLTGTAFRVALPVNETDFELLTGTPKTYIKTSESGERRQQVFCGTCGTPIYAAADTPPGNRTFGLRSGGLDQRDQLIPRRAYWCRSRLDWLDDLGIAETHARQ